MTFDKKAYMKKYKKEYNQRPHVKVKIKQYSKEYYQRPEIKARIKKYNQLPKVKARIKEYKQRPEIKAKNREYNQRPNVKIKKRKYDKERYQRPERKEYMKEYKKEYNETNKFWLLSNKKVYRKNNKNNISEYNKKWRINNPIKVKAHYHTNHHKQCGNECIECSFFKYLRTTYGVNVDNYLGDENYLDFHHTDYLHNEGVTLCRVHHIELHQSIKNEAKLLA